MEDRITHAIHFLSAALKYVLASLCDFQLTAIEAVRAIFAKWITVEASPTVRPTIVTQPPKPTVPLPNPPPIRYPAPTSKGAHGNNRVATSKGVLKQQAPVTPKGGQVPLNYKGDQEPVAALRETVKSLCDFQLTAIEAVRSIFAKCITVEASPTVRPTIVPQPPKPTVPLPNPPPIRYPAPTSKGAHGNNRVATSKGVLKQQAPVTPKGGQVPLNYKGDQEPVAARTRSRDAPPTSPLPFEAQHLPLDAPISVRTRSCTVLENMNNPSRSKALAAQILTHADFYVLGIKQGSC